MVAADRNTVVVAYLVFDKVLLHITHHLHGEFGREYAGILRLVLFQNVRLNRAAYDGECIVLDACINLRGNDLVTRYPEQTQPQTVIPRR